jgi:hypothetical protein
MELLGLNNPRFEEWNFMHPQFKNKDEPALFVPTGYSCLYRLA